MNIIEEIRDALLHDVEKRSPPPRTPMDLLTALQDSWCEKPPGCLQTLVETMTRRVAALLRGGDLFSHIGGLMGCWLGISVPEFAGILESRFEKIMHLASKLGSLG
ncbi:hypothetical protein AVEN_15720-1 [Araneus ventricosus]|uniref:Uncharacterized protein n=1 Tax=Araneus ventricosus TaxID=182803 RepID=A0A4Y2RP56_ARAVE|nr:hypothetical protein AVEN_28259-1 [Araneus ventricosus]GBN77156.1 hypothetical protein AVEN_15720-1 [Araneus ventricosus]